MSEKKPSFKQVLLYEKSQMHPLNRFMLYVITPVYLGVSLLLIVTFGILMGIDDKKFLVLGLSLLGFFALITAVLLSIVPIIKKRVLQEEIASYDFDFFKLSNLSNYDYSYDDISLKFDINGMYVDGDLFYYNHLYIAIVTDSYCHRINIAVRFSVDDNYYGQVRLDAKILKMIYDFRIPVQNKDVLDYIVNNKEQAFKQIYNKGYVKI